MATTAEDIKNEFPIPVFQYMVKVDGMDTIAFSEVSGLSMEVEPITYKDGLSYKTGHKYMPGNTTPVKFTLKKGVVQGNSEFFDWINSIQLNTVDKRDVSIMLMDEEGNNPVVSWEVKNAFPLKLDAPTFDANSNEVAIESIELMASKFTMTYQ